jgi:hypothetical protein
LDNDRKSEKLTCVLASNCILSTVYSLVSLAK